MPQTIATSLRTGTLEDLSAVLFADPLARADRERRQLIHSALTQEQCIVAVDGSSILGFTILNYSFFNQGFVPLLVVAPRNRRSGIGTQLLREAERRCTTTKLFTSSNQSNMPAQCLFEKCGFISSGHVENLDANDDELLFSKTLRPGA